MIKLLYNIHTKCIIKSATLLLIVSVLSLSACQSTKTVTNTQNTTVDIPQRVDVRGSIVATRYSDGQVVIEVESNILASPYVRFDRAFVLVQPVAQLIGPDGRSIGINELRHGMDVAILLRGGGKGNSVGVGVARKLWVIDRFQ